ncbi:MAG: hypothetical protein WKF61_07280 [Luteimonas sp.]
MPEMTDPRVPMQSQGHPVQDAAARRRGVVRTAWTMAGIAIAVYVLFILSGVLGQ